MYLIYLLAFIGNVVIMALEIVASRLVSAMLGNSIYTWTAIIGVVLAGISLGNVLGGRIADKTHPRRILPFVFFINSIFTFSIIPIYNTLYYLERPEYLIWPLWVLLNTTLLFFIPSIIMGMIGPIIAKIAIDKTDPTQTGNIIGRIYAISAIGAIFGVFITGFILISFFGSSFIIAAVATLQALMAIALSINYYLHKLFITTCIFTILPFNILTFAPGAFFDEYGTKLNLRLFEENLVYSNESAYSYIKIYDVPEFPGTRMIVLDNLVHSYIEDTQKVESFFYEYELIYASAIHRVINESFKGKNINSLFIGGGGVVLPRYMSDVYNNDLIDVVEIDPDVLTAAKDFLYLGNKDYPINYYVQDARNFINELSRKESSVYDFVFTDAFHGISVPYQLITKEFNDKIATLLSDNGLYVINLIDDYNLSGRLLSSYTNTLKLSLPYIYIFTTTEDGFREGQDTFVIIAAKNKLSILDLGEREDDFVYSGTLVAWSENSENNGNMSELLNKSNDIILTDDFVPIERLIMPLFTYYD